MWQKDDDYLNWVDKTAINKAERNASGYKQTDERK